MEKRFLPIGTVCVLKNGKKKIMIIGYLSKGEDNNATYDYIGSLYPEGIMSSKKSLLFNHDQIDKIFYKGYESEEAKVFKKFLDEIVSSTKDDEEPELLEELVVLDNNEPTATIIYD